jgi:hypothetical protein
MKVKFVSDIISHVILRGRWCEIILNVHVPTENKVTRNKGVYSISSRGIT